MTWKIKFNTRCIFLNAIAILAPLVSQDELGGAGGQYWPQWRGPAFTGTATHADPPLHWSESNNIRWKAAIPAGEGSTPIVWSNKVYLLTEQSAAAHPFALLCYNRFNGSILWQKTGGQPPASGLPPADSGGVKPSAVTDGSIVCARFGPGSLDCFDMDGNIKWEKNSGPGAGDSPGVDSSPALYGDSLVTYWNEKGANFLVVLDKSDGHEIWRQPCGGHAGAATPLVVDFAGQQQVIVSAASHVRSYDLATGKALWDCGGQASNAVATPVAFDGVVYMTTGPGGAAVQAVKMDRSGEIAGTDAVIWSHGQGASKVASPLLAKELLYTIDNGGAGLSCYDSLTGRPLFEHRGLAYLSGVRASPVEAGGRVYVLDSAGTCLVLKKGPGPEILATNKIAEAPEGSMAVAGMEIFICGKAHLYCVAAPPRQ